ncbi:MAG: hypothetical protein HZB43_01445 [candidate division Zixibacteria bacterium]|nr:hypothetical protein [candidate division Zixibacteria bacterium]
MPMLVCLKEGAAVLRQVARGGEGMVHWRESVARSASVHASSFLYAGASAFLFLVANRFPVYWCLPFLSLTPILYRASVSDEAEGFWLGVFFGLPFLTISVIDTIPASPIAAPLRILLGIGVFALFGWTVGFARTRLGFNPFLIALFWAAFVFGLVHSGVGIGFLSRSGFTLSFLHSIAILLDLLLVALIIILVNSILVAVLEVAVSIARTRGDTSTDGKRNWDPILSPGFLAERLAHVSEGRGPPAGT